eukprot:gene13123-14407_t
MERKRRYFRIVEDIKKDVFRSDWISYETELKVMNFDGKSFEDQVKGTADMDIMIGIHGAAFTNVVFMKPCSVLIEVYPWFFHGWNFFDRFTRSSEVLHYTWMESLENSIQPTQNSYLEDCSKVLESCIQGLKASMCIILTGVADELIMSKTFISPNKYDIMLTDIKKEDLRDYSRQFGFEYNAVSKEKYVAFPVQGIIVEGTYSLLLIPLTVHYKKDTFNVLGISDTIT